MHHASTPNIRKQYLNERKFDIIFPMNTLIVLTAKYLYLVIILIAIVIFFKANRQDKIRLIKLAVIAGPLALIMVFISSHLFYDTRPFVAQNIQPLLPHSPDNGFPSDHTLISMLVALSIYQVKKRAGILLIILAIVVGASRVLAYIHYPVDILGSIVIAMVAVGIASFVLRRITK